MSESMVTRVAKALYEATPFKGTEGGYDEQSEVYRRSCLLLARAAIEAMRQQTPAMDHAGYEAYPGSLIKDGVDHLDIYRAMIDAALEEGK